MKLKKILSMVLAFAMVLSTMGFSVFAEGVTVNDADELAEALKNGGEVILGSDITLGAKIEIPADVTATLDLNGHILSGAEVSAGKHIYAMDNFGTLTVTDSGVDGAIVSRGVYNYGKLTLENGKIDACDGNGGYAVNNEVGSTFIMNGGKVTADYEDGDAPTPGNYDATALDVPEDCTATLNGGTISNKGNFTFAISVGGNLIVPEDSTVSVTAVHGAISVSGGEANIAGGTFKLVGTPATTDSLIYVPSGIVNITGGSFDASETLSESGRIIGAYDGGKAYVNGGTFTSNGWFDFADSAVENVIVTDAVCVDCDDSVKSYVKASATITLNGESYTAPAEPGTGTEEDPYLIYTADELIAALAEDNANVILMNDITATATQATGYGKAGIVVGKGDVVDGNGYKLTINGANDTWDCAVAMTGGTVKNLTVSGAMRGIFMPGADDDVVIDGVVFEDVIYTFNSDAGSKNHTVTIKNTVLNGWTSFSDAHKTVKFEDCTFGEGSGYAYIRPYQPTVFEGCDFEEDFGFDATRVAADSIEFNDCTYDGEDFSEAGWKMFPNGAEVVVDGEQVDYKTYYVITDAAGLVAFRDSVNSGDTTYNQPGLRIALGADIDLAGIDWSVNIGDDCNTTFDGIFDGQGHTISNLTATETAQKGDGYICAGLFGAIYGDAKIMNLNIENVNIDVADFTGNNVGIVAGFAYSATGSIENVNVLGDVKVNAPGAYGVGSIIGYAYYGNPAIKNCSVKANDGSYINAISGAGGIIGYGCGTDVTGCSVENISITATGLVGGIVGLNHSDSFVDNCSAKDLVLEATKAEWVNGVAAAVGTLVHSGTKITNFTSSNITINGVASSKVAGSAYAEQPTTVVPAVSAQVGDAYYVTLMQAFDAAEDGDTITLVDDIIIVDETYSIPAGKTLTLDMNGKKLIVTENKAEQNSLGNFELFYNQGDFTVTGNGSIELTATVDRNWNAMSTIFHNRGGELTIENGTFVHNGGTDMAYVVDNSANWSPDAVTNINGGSLSSTYVAIRNRMDTHTSNGGASGIATVNVTGGDIYGYKRGIWAQVSSNAVKGNINVSGGSITSVEQACIYISTDSTGASDIDTVVSGGTFSSDVSDFVVPGFTLTENVDGTFGVASARALNVSAWKNEVVAGEEVTVAVTLDGEGLANVKWHLTYNPEHFELKNTNVKKITNADGTITIDAYNYLTGKGSYPVGTYWTYDFVAKAQREVVESDFVISETYAYTREESLEGTDVVALNNEKATVKINLIDYQVVASFDGNEVVSGAFEDFDFDGIERRFVVTTTPTATVKYTVNRVEVDEVVVKEEGTYVINYTVVPAPGYAAVEGTYTVTVNKADYVVEFVDDYVPGKTLVLVYTNTDNIFFAYDDELMINVDARGYEYNGVPYAHVFGFVTDGIANGTLADYEAEVEYFYGTGDFYTITAYDEDVNFDSDLDIRDITTVYTVLNAEDIVFSNVKYQKHILKSDLHADKCVDGNDANIVVEKVYPTTNN